MTGMEILAALLFSSKYVLAAVAIYQCLVLFRQSRLVGWKLLALTNLQPFIAVLMRLIQGRPLLTYKVIGADANGLMKISYHLEFPAYYLITVVALAALIGGVRRDTK